MRRRRLLLVLCLVGTATAQEGEGGQPYWVSTPPGAAAALKQAMSSIASRDWTGAAHAIQQVFDRYPAAFAKSGQVYRGARAWATQVLASAPPELREQYERLYGPSGEEALRQALATGDRKGLLDVVRTFEGTAAGLRAASTLADDALQHGRPAEARLLLGRLARLHPSAARDEGIQKRMALAGARDHAEGGPPPLAGARAAATPDESWPMLGGNASRDRVVGRARFGPLRYSIDVDIRQRLWDDPPRPDAGYYPFRGAQRDEVGLRERWSSYNPIEPVVSRSTLVVSDGKRVGAYNLFSGVPLWIYPEEVDVENDGRTNLSSIFTPVVADGIVHVALDVSVPFRAQTLQDVPIIYYIPTRRLVALDLETGAVLWRHDDAFFAAHPGSEPLRSLSLSGAPVARGDRLYLGAVASEGTFHSHIVAIDRFTGELVYATRVSNGQQELNLFGRQLQECMPMPMTESDGVLYFGTNLGIVAAVDALLGTPIWAAAYPTEKIPSTFFWFEAPRRWPTFANGPPLVSGDTVLALPTDGTVLVALDRRTGEQIFSLPPRIYPARQPFVLQTLHATDGERAFIGGPRGVVAIWLVHDPARGANPGEVAWTNWFGEGDTGAGRGFLAEDGLWVPTFNAIYRIDPLSGKSRSAPERVGRDEDTHVHILSGDGVLVTASHDPRGAGDLGIVSARFDPESVLLQARERARLRPDEIPPLLDAGDIHLAAGEVGPAVDLFLKAKSLADARGAAAAGRRAEQGLHRALLRRAHDSLATGQAFERGEGEFDAALRAAPDDRARLKARRDLEEALAGAGEEPARRWRARNLRALERDHGDMPDAATGRPMRGWALLRLADLQVAEGSPRRALAFLQQLVEADADGEDGREAARRITKLLEEHRDAYEPYEKRAAKLFESALAKGDLEALERGLRIYPNAQAAEPATLELARRQLRLHDATGAARTLQAFLAEHALSPLAPEALLLMVEALHERGSHGPAYAALLRLRARHGDAPVPRADGSRAPARTIADEWLSREPYASLSRSARRRDLPPKLRLLFEEELMNDPEVPELLGQIPEALRGAVVLKSGTKIRVLEAETGRERYALDLGLDQPKGPIVLAGGRLYATTEAFVHVFDSANGRALQRQPVPDRGRALSLAEHRGQVFLLYRERPVQGKPGIAALHPSDGSLLWSRLVPAGALDPPGASYQVFAHEERILLLSTQPAEAWVLDPTSGAIENRITLENSLGVERRIDPFLLPGGKVLVGIVTRQQRQGFQYRSTYSVFLLDPSAQGEAAVVWRYRSPGDDDRALRHLNVTGEHVALVDDARGAAVLELETGREVKAVGRLDVPGAADEDRYIDEPQPRHDSLLLVVTPSSDAPARLSAYDLPDLRLRYSVELTENSRELPRLVDAQGVLVVSVGPRRGRVGQPRIRLLDPMSGDLLDEFALPKGGVRWTIAKVQNGVLLVTTDTSAVYAYGPR